MSSYLYNLLTDSEYDYDDTLIDISGGTPKLIYREPPANATFYASYIADINGSWGNGILAGTAYGGASVSNGKLNLKNGTIQYIEYNADQNSDSQQTGCIRFKVIPNYTGSPVTQQVFIDIFQTDGIYRNRISIYHGTGGNLWIRIRDQNSTTKVNQGYTWSPIANTEYEIELNWDGTIGATRLFIDGVQLGPTNTTTFIRNDLIGLMRIGANYNLSEQNPDFEINDMLIYSIVQHTANYTPDWSNIKTLYTTSNPYIDTLIGIYNQGLESISAVIEKTGLDDVPFILKKDDTFYYWDGSQWTESNGTYSQSSTLTNINTNAGSFTTDSNELKLRMFLHSEDGTTTPILNPVTVTYDFWSGPADTIEYTNIWFNTSPGDQTQFKAQLTNKNVKYKENIMLSDKWYTTTPNSAGYIEIQLPDTVNMETDTNGNEQTYTGFFGTVQYIFNVPNQDDANFLDLI